MSTPRPLVRRSTLIAATCALTLVSSVSGCGSSSDGSAPKGPAEIGDAATADQTMTTNADDPPATTTTTVPKPTTTTTTSAPTTTKAPVAMGADTPEATAQRLYDSWKAGDRAGAATVAQTAAVDGIWATAPGDYALYNQCDSGEFGTSGCLFRGNGGTIAFTMTQQGDLWIVTEAVFSGP